MPADAVEITIPDGPFGPSDLIAAVSGKFGVTPSGGSSYAVPITVPPGSAGVQPNLTLVYSNSGLNSIAGLGWAVGGLSTVTRCAAIRNYDGFFDPVDLDANDRLCLNGSRLVPVSGDYMDDGTEYRTSHESFTKVVSYGSAGNGPQNLKAWQRSGEVFEYGVTSDSRMEAADGTNVLSWMLNRITDRSGNYLTFSYYKDAVSGEQRLDRIDYTGNAGQGLSPYNHVQFVYEDRPDDTITFMAGKVSQQTKRLASIEVYADGTLFREYNLTYRSTGEVSQLISIEECLNSGDCLPETVFEWRAEGVNTDDIGLNNVALGASEGITGAAYDDMKIGGSGDFNGDGHTDFYLFPAKPSGRSGGTGGDLVWLGDGDGTFTTVTLPGGENLPYDFDIGASGDFNGDGLTDLMVYKQSDQGRSLGLGLDEVWLSDGDGTFTAVGLGTDSSNLKHKVGTSGDFNGDGLTDLYTYKADQYGRTDGGGPVGCPDEMWLSDGDGTFTVSIPSAVGGCRYYAPTAGDFNGDGLTDLYWHRIDQYGGIDSGQHGDKLWIADGSGDFDVISLNGASGIPSGGFNGSAWYRLGGAADFNRDGLTDLYFYETDLKGRVSGNAPLEVLLATGDNDFERRTTSESLTDDTIPYPGDFNGDGYTDLYFIQAKNQTSLRNCACSNDYMLINTHDSDFKRRDLGSGMGTAGVVHEDFKVGASGDFNADGVTDLYLYHAEGDGRMTYDTDDVIFFGTGEEPGLIERIETGLGLVTEIDYKPMIDDTVYTKGSGATYPAYDLIGTQSLVAAVRADDGIGGQNQQTYSYEQLRAEVDTGSLGFGKMTVMDDATGISTVSEYSQDYQNDLEGLLLASRTVAPGAIVMEESANTWTVQTFTTTDGSPLMFRAVTASTATKRDLNGALMSTVSTSTAYNDYGFATQVTATTTGDGNSYTKVTDNTYGADDVADWILGRVTAATVTHSAPGTPNIVRNSAFTYDATTGQLLTETIEPGTALFHTTTNVYNGFGVLTSVTETWGSTGTDGITATSRTTSFTHDARMRHQLTETNPLGQSQTNTYHALFGVADSTTGPNGLTTAYDFDVLGRTEVEERADGTQTRTYRYLCDGAPACPAQARYLLATESDGGAPVMVYQDILFREVRKTGVAMDGSLVHVDTVYDALGRVDKKSEPYYAGDTVYWTEVTYDLFGRPVLTQRPDGSTQTMVYNGRINVSTNENGQTKTVEKDAAGRMIEVTDDQGNVTTYAYDALDQLVSMSDPLGNTITSAYDARGNKTAMSDPDRGTWTYRYNALDLLVEQTDAIGQTTVMTYDVLGRMLSRIDDAYGLNPQLRTATWTYDTAANGIGKLAEAESPDYEAVSSYDAYGRPSQSTETIDSYSYTVTTTYDAYSRADTLTYPSGLAIKNVYNTYGHMTEVQYAATGTMLWRADEMDARGNVTRFTLGNGVEGIRGFDPENGRISSIYSSLGGQALQNLNYTFDDVGNLIQRSDSRQGYVEDAVYDNLNRVVQVDTTTGVDPGDISLYLPASMWNGTATSIAVTYDILGNITSKTDVGTYGYGETHGDCSLVPGAVTQAGPHAVSSVAGTKTFDYCYDANGNMLRGLSPGGLDRAVTYTAFGKPEMLARGNVTVAFAYGPDRSRFRRVDTFATSTTTTRYVGGKLFEDINRGGTLEQKHYIGDFAVITTAVATGVSTTAYLLKDHLGSTDTVVDAAGAVVERMSFDPWGKRRQTNWVPITDPSGYSAVVTTRGFTGHEQIDPVGLVHMNGRVYDPEIGRFLSADAVVQDITNLQSWNAYTYVLNNPLSMTDPTGFFFNAIAKAIGNFFKAIFKAIGSLFKAIAEIPILRAIVQIVSCASPGLIHVCVAVSAAFTLATGGSIGDAIVSAAIAFAQIPLGPVIDALASAAGALGSIIVPAVQGTISGAFSVAQGGEFLAGFVSGAIGAIGGMIGGPNVSFGDPEFYAQLAIASTAGGIGAELSGGKFANGAVTAAFAYIARATADQIASRTSTSPMMNPFGGEQPWWRIFKHQHDEGVKIAEDIYKALGFLVIDNEVPVAVPGYPPGEHRVYDIILESANGRLIGVEVKTTAGDAIWLNRRQIEKDVVVSTQGGRIIATGQTVDRVFYIGSCTACNLLNWNSIFFVDQLKSAGVPLHQCTSSVDC